MANSLSRRFLRARRFDVNGALGQFQATEDWRRDNEINKLYENFDVYSYEEARKVVSYYRCFTFQDRQRLICIWPTVSAMDRTTRSQRHTDLCLHHQGSK